MMYDSSVFSPLGLSQQFSMVGGTIRPMGPTPAPLTGYATAIFNGYPIAVNAAGNMVVAPPNSRSCGVFTGVEYTDTLLARRYSPQWVASQAGTDIRAWYTLDPYMLYAIQANATLTITAIGQQYDWATLSGNTTTGLATFGLDVASAAANAGLRVVGLVPGPNNEWGDLFPWVLVQISEHQYVADIASV